MTYPSGNVVTYTPDSAGRTLSAIDSGNGINFVTGASYGPDDSLTGFVSGSGGPTAITNAFSYNKRLQPLTMSASSPSQTVFSIGYDFHPGAGDNGNVWGITNYKDTTRSQTFTYDALNRLISAQNAGTNCAATTVNGKTEYWGNSYGYDAWGNLLQKSVTKCSAENFSVAALVNNRLSGYSYDAAGNMTNDGLGHAFTFDAESRIAQVNSGAVNYVYDGDGNRVRKDVSGQASTEYYYFGGNIIAEVNTSTSAWTNYVFFAGERVARRDLPSGSVDYYFSDHLKTASVVTDSLGNIKSESDYYPWGGELQFLANDSNHYKYGGHERDNETNLDYQGARYYSNGLGRFVSSDWSAVPVPVPYADLADPQSLNQYSYVRNVPTSNVDPTGHECPTCPPPTLPDPTPADWESIEEAGRSLGPLGTVIPGVLGGVLLERGLDYAADTSRINSQTEWDSVAASNRIILAKQARPQQQQQQQNQTDQPKADADPQASSGGARQGGGRNAQKSNQNREKTAQDDLMKVKKERDALQSQANKTPKQKAELDRLNKQVKHLQKKAAEQSETHSRKHKGQQQ